MYAIIIYIHNLHLNKWAIKTIRSLPGVFVDPILQKCSVLLPREKKEVQNGEARFFLFEREVSTRERIQSETKGSKS